LALFFRPDPRLALHRGGPPPGEVDDARTEGDEPEPEHEEGGGAPPPVLPQLPGPLGLQFDDAPAQVAQLLLRGREVLLGLGQFAAEAAQFVLGGRLRSDAGELRGRVDEDVRVGGERAVGVRERDLGAVRERTVPRISTRPRRTSPAAGTGAPVMSR